MRVRGEVRRIGGPVGPAEVILGPSGFAVSSASGPPWEAAYRDITTVVVDQGSVLVRLGDRAGAEAWLFERLGAGLGNLVRGLRDGRLRQWLTDGLVELSDEPIELVEIDGGAGAGVAQVLYHERGAVVAPLDDSQPRIRVRRADIGSVEVAAQLGRVSVTGIDGPLARGRPGGSASSDDPAGAPVAVGAIELRSLGQAATTHGARWTALRDGAAADQAAVLDGLIPDAPLPIRRRAATVLREGVPASRADLGDAWPVLERAVLTEPTFAESIAALLGRAGPDGPRWLAMAPESPGATDGPRIWFLVGLPGNLLALELVSAGAHATYLFRVAPRATFDEDVPAGPDLARAVGDVSEALLDGRFLREPMALPADRLAAPEHLRYRLALAALPSLAAARARFVARLVHRDAASWEAALDDVVRWHTTAREESAEWPGRAGQEALADGTEVPTGSPSTPSS